MLSSENIAKLFVINKQTFYVFYEKYFNQNDSVEKPKQNNTKPDLTCSPNGEIFYQK